MASTFTLVTRTGLAVERLFDASLDIDAHQSSMVASGEQAIAGVTSGRIGLGETVTWRARHFGIWFRMTSKITSLDAPHRFVDEQVRGPFRSFHHLHEFARDGDETIMTDTITLASPIFGAVAEPLILVPYLRRLIRQRNHYLVQPLGGSGSNE